MNTFQRPPPEPQGWGPEAIWQRQFLKWVRGILIRSVKGGKLIPDPSGGWHLVIPSAPPVSSRTSGGPVSFFIYVSDGGDYYNCQATTDGVTGMGPFVKVAKEDQELRCSLATAVPAGGAWPAVAGGTTASGRVIRGVTYSYTYLPQAAVTADGVNVGEYFRQVSGSDATATIQKIAPALNLGDVISAIPASFSAPASLKDVKWLAISGREWAGPNPAV